jgi:hypothetical protein
MAEQYFRAKAYRRVTKTTPRPDAEAGPYTEPAEAADWAEQWLTDSGTPDESFVDLYFNGESHIHTSIYLLMENGEKTFGVLNSTHARWPFFYMEGNGVTVLPGEEPFGRDTDDWLPGDSDEDEISDDAEEIDIGDIIGGNDDDMPDDKCDDEPEEDDAAEDEDDSDQDDSDDEKDDDQEEVPRMTIFGKFKGPKGWRKRAETDENRETNTFAVKFGVLDPERITTAMQERNSRVDIIFVERDSRRDAGLLRIKIPSGVTFRDNGKWLEAEIPYTDKQED